MTELARVRELAPHFGLPAAAEVMPLAGGHINATFRVRWPQGDVLLQRVNPAVFPDPEVPCRNGAAALAHLRAKGAACPQPWPTRDGALWRLEPDGCWRAFTFLAGYAAADAPGQRGRLRAAGTALGTLLAHLEDFPAETLTPALPRFHDLAWHSERFAEHALRAEKTLGREFWRLHHALGASLGRRPLEGPPRVIHGDTKLANVLLPRGGGPAVVVDFDTVMVGTLAMDFGDFLRSVAAPETGQAEASATLMGRVTQAGRTFLAPLALREGETLAQLARAPAAMAWMLAQRFLTDHLEGDRYFRVATPGQNLLRGQAQLALASALAALAPALAKALALPGAKPQDAP
jgi:Ser/Thr protein kinase RdoA (MazF antagonist)